MQAKDPHYFVYIYGNQHGDDVEIGIADNLRQNRPFNTTTQTHGEQPKLVYYEHYKAQEEALNRERQIKGGSMDSTFSLIESMNPNWLDLSDTLDD
ncbi:GIY-YIG nuclease family protein [Pontibacter oryzae]|uniref:Excinuclease ABC subunit C n=1 Tax=Pontibacter oryzae TaxID=2304593 RepID=A0A399SGR1_9BACT|nr:excinuclease ABC subunit C [Pontibacter oryzae]RIJ41743.1 excinuclease ABC subunit C [Pontibacter oryzae]